jgi:hypothetical protein
LIRVLREEEPREDLGQLVKQQELVQLECFRGVEQDEVLVE